MAIRTVQSHDKKFDEGVRTTFYNRTGATSAVGGVAFLDLAQGDGDSGSIGAGENNLVAVSTARIATHPLMAVMQTVGADNTVIQASLGDYIETYVLVNSTTDIAKGDHLKPVDAGDHLVKATAGAQIDEGGAVVHDYAYAIALEARMSNDEGLLKVLFFSKGYFV